MTTSRLRELDPERLRWIRKRDGDWAVADWGPGPDSHLSEHPETECSADRDRHVLLDELDRLTRIEEAARAQHGPVCAFCGGDYRDSHYEAWAKDGYISCRCRVASCPIGKALASKCPNCVTPWKCNGPHEPERMDPAGFDIDRAAVLALIEAEQDASGRAG